tara:strand:- start:230 stop:685 length:456 start_codon:yes stop_codon:yes gene_type:complete
MKGLKIFFLTGLILISCSIDYEKSDHVIDHEIYEMRVYYTYDGKFNDIISRFENHTTKLFDKHGFNNVGYWTTLRKDSISFADKFIFQNDGKEALVYIVSFKDMKNRDESWDNFINDPEWIRVFEESRKDGPIVKEIEQVFLSPTIFSNLN